MMERQELIGQVAAAASAAAPAASGALEAEVPKTAPFAGQHRHRGYRASGGGGRTKRRRPLFYAHCASAQQTLLHMTIAKGIKQKIIK